MGGVSIAEAANLAKAALEEEEDGNGGDETFVDFSTELAWEGFAMDTAEGKIGICSYKLGTDNQIALLDGDSLDEIIRFPITFPCTKLQFNKRDTSLFAASSDALRIWRHDALAGIQRVAKLQTHASQAPPLTGFDWDERIALASTDGQVHVFDVEKATVISSVVVHEGASLDVAFKPQSQSTVLATAGKDGQVKLLDLREGTSPRGVLSYHRPVLRMQWMKEEQLALFGLDASEIIFVDERKPNEAVRRLDHRGSIPTAMDGGREENFVISGCSDGQMFLFDHGSQPLACSRHLSGGVDGLRLLNDKTAVVLSKRTIRIFSL
jgi:WD40 repeat protein